LSTVPLTHLLPSYPPFQGGIKQQFKAAVPLVYSLLRGLVGSSSAEASKKTLLDEADAVGVWESDSAALVLFPNADTVPELERLAAVEGRPLLIMNAQWQPGQVRRVLPFVGKQFLSSV
jgi:hypothetical protein